MDRARIFWVNPATTTPQPPNAVRAAWGDFVEALALEELLKNKHPKHSANDGTKYAKWVLGIVERAGMQAKGQDWIKHYDALRDTEKHQERVALESVMLARSPMVAEHSDFALTKRDETLLYLTGLKHDEGKGKCIWDHLFIEEALNETTPVEIRNNLQREIERHVVLGNKMIKNLTVPQLNKLVEKANHKHGLGLALLAADDHKAVEEIALAQLFHHKNYDGTGYPKELSGKGKEIPVLARIITVVDACDTMANKRIYKDEHSLDYVTSELTKEAGRQFDPVLAKAYLNLKTQQLPAPVIPRKTREPGPAAPAVVYAYLPEPRPV